MNKKLLKQAKLFENEEPAYSRVRELCRLASEYQTENEILFLNNPKRGERARIINLEVFFEFLSESQDLNIKSFKELNNILNSNFSRVDNIRYTGDSKSSFIRVFDAVVLIKKIDELPQLYKKNDLAMINDISSFVAIENAETFLNIEPKAHHFSSRYFIYLAGYANTLTREFLNSKSVEFFVDYDIEGMNIYESFECKSKKLHIPNNIERYFTDIVDNKELYKKQRKNLKKDYSTEATVIIELIKKYSTVVEQEILYEAY